MRRDSSTSFLPDLNKPPARLQTSVPWDPDFRPGPDKVHRHIPPTRNRDQELMNRPDQPCRIASDQELQTMNNLDRWPRLLTNIPKEELRRIESEEFTVSELVSYANCPERHFFEHEVGVPRGLDLRIEPWTADSLPPEVKGGVIHELLAGLWGPQDVGGFDQARQALQRQTGPTDFREMRMPDVREVVEDVLLHVERFRQSELFRRVRASHEIRTEAPITYQMRPWIRLVGTADLLFRNAEGWRLVEFKMSSGRDAEEAALDHELQCALYSSAVMAAWWPERVRAATVFFTDTGSSHSWTFTPDRLAWWERHAERIVTEMERTSGGGQPRHWVRERCDDCPFVRLCGPATRPEDLSPTDGHGPGGLSSAGGRS